MKEKYILSIEEYFEILTVKHLEARNFGTDFEHLEAIFEDCTYYVNQVFGLNHFLSINLERIEKSGKNSKNALDWAYALCESHFFDIEEGGHDFVEKFIEIKLKEAMSLEEKLIKCATEL
ncbi:hypothetical protein [Flagellimonas oceanensis]|uniref:hypothetical protein n=1 Tax=Flagellimonas oceanensis TaxID=2499163 RepID=UPI003BAA7B1E